MEFTVRQNWAISRIGTAVSYECAQSSLYKFSPNTKLADINAEFLRRYEKWMVGNGNSITTVGIYLRSLRTMINNAIAEESLSKELSFRFEKNMRYPWRIM